MQFNICIRQRGKVKKNHQTGSCCEQHAEVWSCTAELLGRIRAGYCRWYLSGSAVTLLVAVCVPWSFITAQSDSTMARGEMQHWQRIWEAPIDLVLDREGEGIVSCADELFKGWEILGHSWLDKSQRLKSWRRWLPNTQIHFKTKSILKINFKLVLLLYFTVIFWNRGLFLIVG